MIRSNIYDHFYAMTFHDIVYYSNSYIKLTSYIYNVVCVGNTSLFCLIYIKMKVLCTRDIAKNKFFWGDRNIAIVN